ncbi:hypothetical protein [Devosia sp. LjRoot3]|uniref:hypothetical protein n=1 Tax=Devosia sp. LjRoot3 TaxID=3342319 RepID=UPI003ECFC51C
MNDLASFPQSKGAIRTRGGCRTGGKTINAADFLVDALQRTGKHLLALERPLGRARKAATAWLSLTAHFAALLPGKRSLLLE